jgi:hypothetical protein
MRIKSIALWGLAALLVAVLFHLFQSEMELDAGKASVPGSTAAPSRSIS